MERSRGIHKYYMRAKRICLDASLDKSTIKTDQVVQAEKIVQPQQCSEFETARSVSNVDISYSSSGSHDSEDDIFNETLLDNSPDVHVPKLKIDNGVDGIKVKLMN